MLEESSVNLGDNLLEFSGSGHVVAADRLVDLVIQLGSEVERRTDGGVDPKSVVPQVGLSNEQCSRLNQLVLQEFQIYLIASEEEKERPPVGPPQPEAVASLTAVPGCELGSHEARYFSRRFGQQFR